jgi:hypothetical protein
MGGKGYEERISHFRDSARMRVHVVPTRGQRVVSFWFHLGLLSGLRHLVRCFDDFREPVVGKDQDKVIWKSRISK